jgi:hypothetical protein
MRDAARLLQTDAKPPHLSMLLVQEAAEYSRAETD